MVGAARPVLPLVLTARINHTRVSGAQRRRSIRASGPQHRSSAATRAQHSTRGSHDARRYPPGEGERHLHRAPAASGRGQCPVEGIAGTDRIDGLDLDRWQPMGPDRSSRCVDDPLWPSLDHDIACVGRPRSGDRGGDRTGLGDRKQRKLIRQEHPQMRPERTHFRQRLRSSEDRARIEGGESARARDHAESAGDVGQRRMRPAADEHHRPPVTRRHGWQLRGSPRIEQRRPPVPGIRGCDIDRPGPDPRRPRDPAYRRFEPASHQPAQGTATKTRVQRDVSAATRRDIGAVAAERHHFSSLLGSTPVIYPLGV